MTIELTASEFKQLEGELNILATFSPDAIREPARANKTGARHSSANWLLFPVTLRRRFKASNYDFDHITCGTLNFRDNLFVVYKVPKKFVGMLEER